MLLLFLVQLLMRFVDDESRAKRGQGMDISVWPLKNYKNIPQQLNGVDCGKMQASRRQTCSQGEDFRVVHAFSPTAFLPFCLLFSCFVFVSVIYRSFSCLTCFCHFPSVSFIFFFLLLCLSLSMSICPGAVSCSGLNSSILFHFFITSITRPHPPKPVVVICRLMIVDGLNKSKA